MADGIRCIRLWTGADGLSHVEETAIADGTLQAATGLRFAETRRARRWTGTRRRQRQCVLALGGTLAFVTRDGEGFLLRPGDVPWRRVYVTLG